MINKKKIIMADFEFDDFEENIENFDSEEEVEDNMSNVDSEDLNEENSDNENNESDNEAGNAKAVNDDDNEVSIFFDEDNDNDIDNDGIRKSISLDSDEYVRINDYKNENIKRISKSGVISLLSSITTYLKEGNRLLDNLPFKYPDSTPESMAIMSIIANTHPFVRVIKDKRIESDLEDWLIPLKQVLRVVDSNTIIMFPKDMIDNFPIFKKRLFFDDISKEEIDEIKAFKKKYNLN